MAIPFIVIIDFFLLKRVNSEVFDVYPAGEFNNGINEIHAFKVLGNYRI